MLIGMDRADSSNHAMGREVAIVIFDEPSSFTQVLKEFTYGQSRKDVMTKVLDDAH